MSKFCLAAIVAFVLAAGCSQSNSPEDTASPDVDASASLNALFDEFFERSLEMNPLSASFVGDYRFNDRLANSNSPEFIEASKAMDEEFLARLLEIDRDSLGEQDRLSYDLFRLNRQNSIEGYQFPGELIPINQFYSMTSQFVQLGSGASAHPFNSVKDYDDFLSRADDFSRNVDQVIANMKQGMAEGYTQPRILMEKLKPQVDAQVVSDPQESTFYAPVTNMPEDFSAADRERLTAAYEAKIMDTIVPAYQRVSNFLSDDYIDAARETVGMYDLPDGDAWYAYNVRTITTTDLTPDEIHQIGLDEVARIHGEMRGVMVEVGFEGGLQDFFDFVNTDDQFFYDEPHELIDGYKAMADGINESARALFDLMPNTTFEIRRVEPFREASAAGGYYSAGTPDGTRPGIFYANAYNIKARPKWAMESLYLHEAIPGHHFQIMIQRENEDLPQFRRFGGYTAYSEGWGLYAESLGKELGGYTDPYSYFGALNAELWRAIRLVVDTGIHSQQWTRQQVLDYMYANSAVAEVRAVAEAERFMAIPGQALAYKVGQLKIREIRNNAEARLGDKFDVKDFHTQVLKDGALPLSMLEAKIDRWIDAQ